MKEAHGVRVSKTVRKVPCPMCDGEDTTSNPCKSCGGGQRVTRKVASAIKGMMETAQRGTMADLALSVITGLRSLEAERERLAALPVPASFLWEKPDTPESQAARVQLLHSQGMPTEEANRRVYGRG